MFTECPPPSTMFTLAFGAASRSGSSQASTERAGGETSDPSGAMLKLVRKTLMLFSNKMQSELHMHG
eukprot:SAG31_NODE_5666_length_2394_cov_1.342919_2_plen_67_part_00